MKLLRKRKWREWSYYGVIGICMLGLLTIVGTGGGGGDGGGGGSETVSYSAKGYYYLYESYDAESDSTYWELDFVINESDMPEDYGFQKDEWYSYEIQYYPDEDMTEPYADIIELWGGVDFTEYVEFARVGERSSDPDEQVYIVGTWGYTDEYDDAYTLILGPSEWSDEYQDYSGDFELTVTYTEEGIENPDTLPPPQPREGR